MKENVSESHKRIVEILRQHDITNYRGGIQLFASQLDSRWGISVNFNGTGLSIDRTEIDETELIDDELITLNRSWVHKFN